MKKKTKKLISWLFSFVFLLILLFILGNFVPETSIYIIYINFFLTLATILLTLTKFLMYQYKKNNNKIDPDFNIKNSLNIFLYILVGFITNNIFLMVEFYVYLK